MLSYRHAFHAGNHADVLKHAIEVAILKYLIDKDRPFCYVDSHAGPGGYELGRSFALKNKEFETGISKLWQQPKLPKLLKEYVDCVALFNNTDALTYYPGSPAIALQVMVNSLDKSRLQLFEQHRQEYSELKEWAHKSRAVKTYQQDGFSGLISVLPPKEKRALVLIDPPYEVKTDYSTLIDTLKTTLSSFSTGTYLIWHPLLSNAYKKSFVSQLCSLSNNWLYAQSYMSHPSEIGMYGSGVLVINPPWTLHDQLEQALPILVKLLSQQAGAGYHLSQSES